MSTGMFSCECGFTVRSPRYPVRCRCGRRYEDPDNPTGSVAPDAWPLWAKKLKGWSIHSDAGVGDTFARLAALGGGEYVKRLAASIGISCGCTGRQARWNQLYPY